MTTLVHSISFSMNKTRKITFCFAIMMVGILHFAPAQNRLHSGIFYHPGDTIYAPMYGIEAQIPEGWHGLLPQGSELFLLTSAKDEDSRVFIRASENSYENLKNSWKNGLELADNLKVVVKEDIKYRGGVMYANVDVEGELARNYKTYVEARCGNYGKCVSFLLQAEAGIFEELKKEMMAMVDRVELKEPGMANIYEDFDWHEFMTGKYLMAYDQKNYKSNYNTNELWLYADGQFKSRVERKGLVDEKKGEYWGKNKGSWEIEGTGQEGKLILNFKKHEPLHIDLLIEEDKVFLNEQRYFVMIMR